MGTLIPLKSVFGVDVGYTVDCAFTLDIHYSNHRVSNLKFGIAHLSSKWVHSMITTNRCYSIEVS